MAGRLLLCLLSLCGGVAAAESECQRLRHVIGELQELINESTELRLSLNYTVASAPEQWSRSYGHDLDGLSRFFQEWLCASVYPDGNDAVSSVRTASAFPHVHLPTNATSFVSPIWALSTSSDDAVFFRDAMLIEWLGKFVAARGKFMDSAESWTRDVEAAWRARVNFTDYIVPHRGYNSFNEFFTREIRASLRPVAARAQVVSAAADGYLWMEDANISLSSNWNLKADSFGLQKLLGYDPSLTNFIGGIAVANFLAAPDYHHCWFPVSGVIVAAGQLGGFYLGTDDDRSSHHMADHRRAYVVVDTGSLFGHVGIVMVGLYDISGIVFADSVHVGRRVSKGERIGHFAYGGSEVLMLFEKGRIQLDEDVGRFAHMTTRQVGQQFATSPASPGDVTHDLLV